MAIQPIDLQTMYTALEKVSKEVSFKQQGQPLQNSMTEAAKARKFSEEKQTVQKTEDEKKLETVKERSENKNDTANDEKNDKDTNQAKQKDEKVYEQIKDPSLGQHIDISG